MPWHIEHRKGDNRPYKIIKTATGEVVGSSTSEGMAKKAIAARYVHEKKMNKGGMVTKEKC